MVFTFSFSRSLLGFIVMLTCGSLSAFELSESRDFKVALVDKFYPGDEAFESAHDRDMNLALYGMLDIDGDRQREPLYHGDIVRLIVSHPKISVIPYALRPGQSQLQELLYNLEMVRRDLFWEEDIDAVLLPWESSTLIASFDKSISKSRVKKYLKEIERWGSTSDTWRLTLEIILVLEDISDRGAMVYTIAGNGGARMVNTYSFAENVVTVGASEVELKHFIADNDLVDTKAKAAYQIKRVDNATGLALGYDIDGDSCIDIPVDQLSQHGPRAHLPRTYWKVIKGSSFAAPGALKKKLLGSNYTANCVY